MICTVFWCADVHIWQICHQVDVKGRVNVMMQMWTGTQVGRFGVRNCPGTGRTELSLSVGLVNALVCGFTLPRLVLGVVCYTKHTECLFKVSYTQHLTRPALLYFFVSAIPCFDMVQHACF